MIAFIFPGQGAQKVGMGRALADAYPICRETFEEADAALGEPLSRIIFDGPEDQLTRTENTQPAILAVSTAAARLLASRGLAPELRAIQAQTPRVPIVANVDAELKRDPRAAIEALVQQVSSPVRWEAVVRRLASEGVTTYVEVGPGTVLSGLVRKIHREATVVHFGSPDDLAAIEPLIHV